MQKKRNTRLVNGVDILVVLGCIIGMLFSGQLFWNDLNLSISKINEEPLAVIYFKHNTAQRRLVDRNLWERLKQASPVYNGDRIRTAVLSEAVAIFADGAKIDLHENTLIQVFKNKEKTAIDFIDGSISASTAATAKNGTLSITAGQKTLEFSAGSSASISVSAVHQNAAADVPADGKSTPIEARADQPVSVTVIEGSLSVRDAKDTDIPEIEHVDASSVVSLFRDPVQSFISDVAEQGISQVVRNASDVLSQNVSAITSSDILEAESKKSAIVEELTSGESAVFVSGGQISSTTTELADAETLKPLKMFLPTSSMTVLHDADKTPELTCFWESGSSIQIEFSHDASFSDILFSQEFPATQKTALIPLKDTLDDDTVFWRVKSLDGAIVGAELSEHEVATETRNAISKTVTSAAGVVFVQLTPKQSVEAVLASFFAKPSDEVIAATVAKPVALSTMDVEPVEPVVEEIIAEPESPVEVVPAVEIAPKEVAPKKEVAAVIPAPAKQKEEPPKPKPVPQPVKPAVPEFSLLTPVLTAPADKQLFTDAYFETAEQILFEWKKIGNAKSYVFTLSAKQSDESLKQVLTANSKTNSYSLAGDDLAFIDTGTFMWTVQAIDGENIESKEASASFVVDLSSLGTIEIDTTEMINNR